MYHSSYILPSKAAELHSDGWMKYPQRKDGIIKALREALTELKKIKESE